jgi:L-fucose mutarotase
MGCSDANRDFLADLLDPGRYKVRSSETKIMLKNLSPLHTPELLHTLASMGHGDDLAIVDAHFPAVTMAKRLVRLDGIPAPAVLEACLRLIPLDNFVEDPALRMEVVNEPDLIPEVQKEFQRVIDQEEGRHLPLSKLERHAFYERARSAYAVVATGELRPYGCVLIKKGVVLN